MVMDCDDDEGVDLARVAERSAACAGTVAHLNFRDDALARLLEQLLVTGGWAGGGEPSRPPVVLQHENAVEGEDPGRNVAAQIARQPLCAGVTCEW